MNQLIKFEFRKLFKSTAFIVCAILTLVALIISALMLYMTYQALYEIEEAGVSFREYLEILGVNSFELTYEFANSSMLYLLSGIFVSIFVCKDYSSFTIKNVYSKGYTRRQVYFSKYIVSLVGVMIITSLAYIVSILAGLLLFGKLGPFPKYYLLILLLQLIVITVYHAFHFFISNSLGKSGGAVSLCIVLPTGVNLLTSLFDLTMKNKVLISDYWISNLSSLVVKNNIGLDKLGFVALVSICHIAIWLGLGYLVNRKKQF